MDDACGVQSPWARLESSVPGRSEQVAPSAGDLSPILNCLRVDLPGSGRASWSWPSQFDPIFHDER
jgi:hypothetical protein